MDLSKFTAAQRLAGDRWLAFRDNCFYRPDPDCSTWVWGSPAEFELYSTILNFSEASECFELFVDGSLLIFVAFGERHTIHFAQLSSDSIMHLHLMFRKKHEAAAASLRQAMHEVHQLDAATQQEGADVAAPLH